MKLLNTKKGTSILKRIEVTTGIIVFVSILPVPTEKCQLLFIYEVALNSQNSEKGMPHSNRVSNYKGMQSLQTYYMYSMFSVLLNAE